MAWYYIVIIFIASNIFVGILSFLIVGYFAYRSVCFSKDKVSIEKQRLENIDDGFDTSELEKELEPMMIQCDDKYILHGYLKVVDVKKFVVICHGHGTNHVWSLPYAKMFIDLGYSIFVFDQRGHGDNDNKKASTMGYKEAKDLNLIISMLKEKFGQDIEVGLLGASMGGTTVLLETQYRQDISFIIADCAYSSLRKMYEDLLNKYHAPTKLLLPIINLCFKIFNKFKFSDVDVSKHIKNSHVPLLIIHGMSDDLIMPNNASLIYELANEPKEIHFFKGATHAKSFNMNSNEYTKIVSVFINQKQ